MRWYSPQKILAIPPWGATRISQARPLHSRGCKAQLLGLQVVLLLAEYRRPRSAEDQTQAYRTDFSATSTDCTGREIGKGCLAAWRTCIVRISIASHRSRVAKHVRRNDSLCDEISQKVGGLVSGVEGGLAMNSRSGCLVWNSTRCMRLRMHGQSTDECGDAWNTGRRSGMCEAVGCM